MFDDIFNEIIEWVKVDTIKKVKVILITILFFSLISFCVEKITTKNLPPTEKKFISNLLDTTFENFSIKSEKSELGTERIINFNRNAKIEVSLSAVDLISKLDKNMETINDISGAIGDLQNISHKKGKIIIPKEAVCKSTNLDFLNNEYIGFNIKNPEICSWVKRSQKFIFFPHTEKNTVFFINKFAIKESDIFYSLKGSKSFTFYEISTM